MSLKFDFEKKGEKDVDLTDQVRDIERYPQPTNARSLRFVNIDGSWTSLYYLDLRAVKYVPDENSIRLRFIMQEIVLKGRNLEKLVEDLESQSVKIILCFDKRYEATRDSDECFVTEIIFKGGENPPS